MTAVDLARIQFALTANVHFLFVVVTLGLAPLVAVMETRYVLTGRAVHETMTRFFGQIYVVNYGIGIVTGLVMEFQFGLNWTGVSQVAGQVFGAPLALETLIAFFAEATFLGLWIFGWGRLPKVVHLVLIYLVTLTAYASAYFIMVANGYLQHPVGATLRDGAARITDVSALLTNPNAVGAVAHIVPGALFVGGVVVAGVSAWHLRRQTGHDELFIRSLRVGVIVGVPAALATVILGYAQFGYLDGQPLKRAALTGFSDHAHVAALQAGMVAQHGPGNYLPPAWLATPYTVMTTIGELSFVIGLFLLPFLIRRWIVKRKVILRIMSWFVVVPFVAVICGWLVREVGRQPWVIYGVLKTPDAAAGVGVPQVAFSLAVFGLVVLGLAVTDWVVLTRMARRGPAQLALGSTLGEQEDAAQPPPEPWPSTDPAPLR